MRHALARSSARRSLAVLLPVIVAGTALAAPSVARADEPSAQDIAQARQLGQQAAAAFEAGNYVESEKLWNAASRLYFAPTLTLGLARTQAKLGKLVAAQESYNKIIREWSDKPTPQPAFKDALESAKTEVQAVSSRVASVTISIDGTVPPNAQVTIDGQPVNAAALGLRRPVDPGTHQVKATADGYKTAETSFEVKEGGSAEAKLHLEKDPNAAVAGAAVTGGAGAPAGGTPGGGEPPPAEKPASGSNKTLAIAAFGVGGAGLVLGAVTGFIALGKHSDLEKQCPGGTCPASVQDDVDGYKTMGTLSTVGFIVAGVGGVAGAVLLLTSPKQTGAAGPSRYATVKTSPTITPYLGLGGGGVSGSF